MRQQRMPEAGHERGSWLLASLRKLTTVLATVIEEPAAEGEAVVPGGVAGNQRGLAGSFVFGRFKLLGGDVFLVRGQGEGQNDVVAFRTIHIVDIAARSRERQVPNGISKRSCFDSDGSLSKDRVARAHRACPSAAEPGVLTASVRHVYST